MGFAFLLVSSRVCLVRPLREHTKNANTEAFCSLAFTWKFLLSAVWALVDGTAFSFPLCHSGVYNPEAEGLHIKTHVYSKNLQLKRRTLETPSSGFFLSVFLPSDAVLKPCKARKFWNEKPTVNVVSHFENISRPGVFCAQKHCFDSSCFRVRIGSPWPIDQCSSVKMERTPISAHLRIFACDVLLTIWCVLVFPGFSFAFISALVVLCCSET